MLVTDQPENIPTTNALDEVPDDLLGGPPPPAYLVFGTTPAAIEEPPANGDVVVYMVRARCKGEHGPLTRADGEERYKRDMQIQAIWLPGDPEPEEPKTQAELDAEAEAEAAKAQPPLFDDAGDPATGDGNVVEFGGRPPFSDGEG